MNYKIMIYKKELSLWITIVETNNWEQATKECAFYRNNGFIVMIEY